MTSVRIITTRDCTSMLRFEDDDVDDFVHESTKKTEPQSEMCLAKTTPRRTTIESTDCLGRRIFPNAVYLAPGNDCIRNITPS